MSAGLAPLDLMSAAANEAPTCCDISVVAFTFDAVAGTVLDILSENPALASARVDDALLSSTKQAALSEAKGVIGNVGVMFVTMKVVSWLNHLVCCSE